MPKFNLNPESLLDIPGRVWTYWKNQNGLLLGCNDLMAKSLRLSSPKDIVGRTDHDLPFIQADEAELYRMCDRQVMECGMTMQFEDTATLQDQRIHFLVIKTPFFNKQTKKILGIVGVSHYLPTTEQAGMLSELLTKRENEVFRLLIRGHSAKKIGQIIQISHRTVEHYIEKIRFKTKSSSRGELIDKFIDYIF